MSIEIDILLDLASAETEAQAFEREITQTMARAANRSAQEFEGFARKATATLERLKNEQTSRINDLRGSWGDMRDIWDTAGQSLLGLSDSTSKAVSETAYLAEKGLALGASFGPWGAAIGAVAGSLLGLVKAMFSAGVEADKLKEKLRVEEEKKQRTIDEDSIKGWEGLTEAVADAGEGLGRFDKSLTKMQDKLKDLPKEQAERANALVNSALEWDKHTSQGAFDQILKDYHALESKTTDVTERQKARKAALKELRKAEQEYSEGVSDALEAGNEALGEHTKKLSEAKNAARDLAAEERNIREEIMGILAARKEREENSLLDKEGMRDSIDYVQDLKTKLEDLLAVDSDEGLLDVEGMVEGFPKATDEAEKLAIAVASIQEALMQNLDPVERALIKLTGLSREMAGVVISFGQEMANTFAGQAAKSADAFFESIARGQNRTMKDRKAARAQFFRDLGTELIADGTKNELIGVGRGLFGDPSGWALAAWGLGEQLTGISMGGLAAGAQRRQGYGEETSSTGATGSRGSSGGGSGLGAGQRTQAPQQPVIYQIYMGGAKGSTTINAGDGPSSTAQAHRELEKIKAEGTRVGSGGFSRRKP